LKKSCSRRDRVSCQVQPGSKSIQSSLYRATDLAARHGLGGTPRVLSSPMRCQAEFFSSVSLPAKIRRGLL
jgi:hypothetical protein